MEKALDRSKLIKTPTIMHVDGKAFPTYRWKARPEAEPAEPPRAEAPPAGYVPTKTVTSYKLFRVSKDHPGEIFPLFVDANTPIPFGEWVAAKPGDRDPKVTDHVKSKLGPLAYRPGFHAGRIPVATHIGLKVKKNDKAPSFRNPDYVWAEVTFADDVDWQSEAARRAVRGKDGQVIARTAHITDQVPYGGYYSYKTNSNMTGEWMISGTMKVNRILTDAEVAEINEKTKFSDLPRVEPLDISVYGFGKDGRPAKSVQLLPDRDFYDYQDSHMEKTHKRLFYIDDLDNQYAEWIENAGDIGRELASHQETADPLYIGEKLRKLSKVFIFAESSRADLGFVDTSFSFPKTDRAIIKEYVRQYDEYKGNLGVLGQASKSLSYALLSRNGPMFLEAFIDFVAKYNVLKQSQGFEKTKLPDSLSRLVDDRMQKYGAPSPVAPKEDDSEFKRAGKTVDGLEVLDDIPNTSSIGSSLNEYESLPGIREVPMSVFSDPDPYKNYYAADDIDRTYRLAEEIKQSGQIKPLIVVMDKKGPYILEGGHRWSALGVLGKKSFPALVVMDTEDTGVEKALDYSKLSKVPVVAHAKVGDYQTSRWKKREEPAAAPNPAPVQSVADFISFMYQLPRNAVNQVNIEKIDDIDPALAEELRNNKEVFKKKLCYNNSWQAASMADGIGKKVNYVEGFVALGVGGCMIPIDHAWNSIEVNGETKYFDVTNDIVWGGDMSVQKNGYVPLYATDDLLTIGKYIGRSPVTKAFEAMRKIRAAARDSDMPPSFASVLSTLKDKVGEVKKSLTYGGHPLEDRYKVHGMDISIETKKGSTRRGTDKDGHEWATKMNADYGYIRGTVGKDKDHLDCYVGPNPESTKVFIVHQNDPTTGKYDEDKVMLGFESAAEAKALYMKQYDRPGFFGSMDETDIEKMKERAFSKEAKGRILVVKSVDGELEERAGKGYSRLDKLIERKYGPEVMIGVEVELEHTGSREEAKRIALDHLHQDYHYYSKLIAAGLVDEPRALAIAKEEGVDMKKSLRLMVPILDKAMKSSKLILQTKMVTREGTTFPMKVWVLPGEASHAAQFDMFEAAEVDDTVKKIAPREPERDPVKIEAAIQSATPETRNEVQAVLFGAKEEEPEAAEPPYEFTPGRRTVSAYNGHGYTSQEELEDYTGVFPKRMKLIRQAKALNDPRPSWIPAADEGAFSGWKWERRFPYARIAPNEYVVQVTKEKMVIMSADVLIATTNYYKAREKERRRIEADKWNQDKRERARIWLEEHKNDDDDKNREFRYKSNIKYYREVVDGKRFQKPKAVVAMGSNKMCHDQSCIIKKYSEDDDYSMWTHLHDAMEELDQKAIDMQLQAEDDGNTYSKGEKTSYGNMGTKDTLLEKYGVKVKRQNGKEITDTETEEIKAALDHIFSIFGDRSSMARTFGLKISHAAETAMHARKAIGIFFPSHRAIGVSAGGGAKQFGFTLSHEWAHFMDNYLGGDKYHYSSDDFKSISHAIANTFKSNMAKKQKSDYQNRTCECFARAFEQYFAMKTGDGDEYQRMMSDAGNHPSNDVFLKEVSPLIDRFFSERGDMLKAMKITLWSIR